MWEWELTLALCRAAPLMRSGPCGLWAGAWERCQWQAGSRLARPCERKHMHMHMLRRSLAVSIGGCMHANPYALHPAAACSPRAHRDGCPAPPLPASTPASSGVRALMWEPCVAQQLEPKHGSLCVCMHTAMPYGILVACIA